MLWPTRFDPFATKGSEYLLVCAFLPLLVWYWRMLRGPMDPAVQPAPAVDRTGMGHWFELSPGAFYHPGHSWAAPGDKDLLRVGMDDFAQKLIGRPTRIVLPRQGERVVQGASAWQVQVDAKTVEVLSPVSGVVVARNDAVADVPGLVNRDPYGDGWLLDVWAETKPNLTSLMHGDLARAWMDVTLEALRKRMSPPLGVVMQDGGRPVDGIARALSPDSWDEVARDFLLSG